MINVKYGKTNFTVNVEKVLPFNCQHARQLETTESLPSTLSQTLSESLDLPDVLSISDDCEPSSSLTNYFPTSTNPELSLPLPRNVDLTIFINLFYVEVNIKK